jgi:translation initiation factor IF-3
MKSALPVQKDGPRINEDIRVREVQLIDASGHNHGPTPIQTALEMAQAAGLDLVEIAPNSAPPVCKLLDYGKYKFQAQKKAAEARKKQKVVEIKEIKLRPMIDDHDYQVKMRSMQRFFEEGDKVKITLRFRGREMAHQELGYKLLQRVKEDTEKISKVESEPRFEGRQMVMLLAPRADCGWRFLFSDVPLPNGPRRCRSNRCRATCRCQNAPIIGRCRWRPCRRT